MVVQIPVDPFCDALSPEESCLMTGLPFSGKSDPNAMKDFALGLARWKKVRMIGSAAMSLAHVAAGHTDYYREKGIFWWDVAAPESR